MTGHAPTERRPWLWPAAATPLVVGLWVAAPRVAMNRPSYGVHEAVILATAVLAVPCVYAIARLRVARSGGLPELRRWVWAAAVAFAALPVVLTVAGDLVPVAGGAYPDDKIPGLTAGFVSAAAAILCAAVGLGWLAVGRLAAARGAVSR